MLTPAIPVKLEVFEGPLDLLLHLIEKNKVDIYDIPIVTITEQYLDYIKKMETEDMNVMSEFLVMAATLLDIKARMLLPKEINEDGEEEDPRAELVQQLLEYKMCKYMAYELKDRQVDASHTYYRMRTLPKEVEEFREPVDLQDLLGDTTLAKLQELFQLVVRRSEDKIDPVRSSFGNIRKEEIDMEEKTAYIMDYITGHRNLLFIDLLREQRSRIEIIVTFLVILEMIRIGQVTIRQDRIFGDIYISAVPDFQIPAGFVMTAGA
ncbi:MAG: segregation/condensation protein A [Lachnospiraceae bacterium]|nr:segregation/condensation protein A [Lachnospiraceae bacterium]